MSRYAMAWLGMVEQCLDLLKKQHMTGGWVGRKELTHMGYNPYPRRKFGNKKVLCDGMIFDSQKEARRYHELKLRQQAGEISGLECQKVFELIPKQVDEDGKCIERDCKYIADFVYTDKDGRTVVEDTKGYKTPDYIIKRKLMLKVHGIRVREI